MDLYTKIMEVYPEIDDKEFWYGSIELKDDGDGIVYIRKWEYSKPLPKGLKLGKPSA
jgi:hypothetical protein